MTASDRERHMDRYPDDFDDFDDEGCYECGGEGFIVAECFEEDTCCCADPEEQHGFATKLPFLKWSC